jgi:rhamnulose-1-phosphate aldolase
MKEIRIFKMSDLIADIGQAGVQTTAIGAAEGSAGNISVFVKQLTEIDPRFVIQSTIDLPTEVPFLGGGWALITGTGRRLRDVATSPEKSVCLLKIQDGGKKADLYSGDNFYPTSELNSHLAVQNDQVRARNLDFHVVMHVQPLYTTMISHIDRYCDQYTFNHSIIRWEPETVATFPEGVGMLPYCLPGSQTLMDLTLAGLREHKIVVWQRHGVVSRSDMSTVKAADYVEYLETAARYEFMNLQIGEQSQGLSKENLLEICKYNHIEPKYI